MSTLDYDSAQVDGSILKKQLQPKTPSLNVLASLKSMAKRQRSENSEASVCVILDDVFIWVEKSEQKLISSKTPNGGGLCTQQKLKLLTPKRNASFKNLWCHKDKHMGHVCLFHSVTTSKIKDTKYVTLNSLQFFGELKKIILWL